MSQDKADAILAKITPSADYSKLANCQRVVAAVFEDAPLKQKTFKIAREHMPADASSLPINDLEQELAHTNRFNVVDLITR